MQYLFSVIYDGSEPADPNEMAALRLAADGSRACNRKVEVRPFG
jgi:hypothetical protein